ncbi:MAG: hypothetical protein HOW73_11910 [Polyangiaceae bacterium]|nr:hypothetical protein [Polyangiaceae bacterium]
MMVSRRPLMFALAGGLLSLAACNGAGGAPKTASVTPGDMPEGADWTGKYFDQVYGYFHLIQEGKSVSGKWERPQKDRWGDIHGEVTGNVFKFSWTEYTRGAVGQNANRSGKGYFVYKRPAGENVDDLVEGELGRGQDEVGEKLTAVKQRNEKADPDSIGGTQATDFQGGDWDQPNKEEGKTPEQPAPPP